ncbi:urease accessory protein UreD [Paenibacillaceae bacterium WGS1546]|uniref:urease accessory protein UreD n=1 Tax=Cohnella sp. WGS1546 TaxID=3366810 RepID=UPI00372D450C
MLPPSDAAPAAAPCCGRLPLPERSAELRAVAGLANGKPELLSRYHTSPLKIAKSFPLRAGDADQLAVVQMDGSPGMLEGDRYSFDWRLRDGVRLYVTNQSHTRVHPCDKGDARLRQRFDLQPGAVLEWLPEPVMLFRDARFVAETEVELAERAVCMISDIVCPGRTARGEAFVYRGYDAKLTVHYRGEMVHYQRQKWEPERLPIGNAGCFGPYTHVGSFLVFSDRATSGLAEKIREALIETGAALGSDVAWGASRTARHGIALQAAGNAAWKLQRLFLAAWDCVRRELLGLPPLRLLKEAWM